MSMESQDGRPSSHLFTIRVWEEEDESQQSELRGKVQLLTTGEVRYFREWATLVPLLLAMLAELEPDGLPKEPS